MSLYDDIDTDKKSENVSGWATGIKFLQSHMQLKKATVTQPKRDGTRKPTTSTLSPVVNLTKGPLNSGNSAGLGLEDGAEEGNNNGVSGFGLQYSVTLPKETKKKHGGRSYNTTYLAVDPEWQFENEYDPLWPNDYEKALKELRDRRDKEAEVEESKRKTGDERDEEDVQLSHISGSSRGSGGGVAIAPPPSLQDNRKDKDSESTSISSFPGSGSGGISAAARIMAKYGYKEGQGLGRQEQGMSTALQVEKTSHRIGRIIHEKDIPKPVFSQNPLGLASSMAAYNDIVDEDVENMDDIETSNGDMSGQQLEGDSEPSLADILKNPSKVVLLKNMVGPGEVDDDLEPEVKEECTTKYGNVNAVTIFQMPDVDADGIRIFVEFSRVESAVKALVDLNGRFFGGKQVKASFYDYEKYNNLELTL